MTTKKTETAPAVEVAPSNFLMFIGESFYTKETYIEEANTLGVSKRLPSFRLPADLVAGKSKVYLAAGGGRKYTTAEGEEKKEPAAIFGYFIPDAIEFIAGPDGAGTYADIIAAVKGMDGGRIVTDTTTEKDRKCGRRKVGGTYLVAKEGTSPLVLITEQSYEGGFFRGMMRLNEEQNAAVTEGKGLRTLLTENCMLCFTDFLTSPDTAKRAARERRRMEKGEAAKWFAKCPKCAAEARKEKRAAAVVEGEMETADVLGGDDLDAEARMEAEAHAP